MALLVVVVVANENPLPGCPNSPEPAEVLEGVAGVPEEVGVGVDAAGRVGVDAAGVSVDEPAEEAGVPNSPEGGDADVDTAAPGSKAINIKIT